MLVHNVDSKQKRSVRIRPTSPPPPPGTVLFRKLRDENKVNTFFDTPRVVRGELKNKGCATQRSFDEEIVRRRRVKQIRRVRPGEIFKMFFSRFTPPRTRLDNGLCESFYGKNRFQLQTSLIRTYQLLITFCFRNSILRSEGGRFKSIAECHRCHQPSNGNSFSDFDDTTIILDLRSLNNMLR